MLCAFQVVLFTKLNVRGFSFVRCHQSTPRRSIFGTLGLREIFLAPASRPALGPTQSPVKDIGGYFPIIQVDET